LEKPDAGQASDWLRQAEADFIAAGHSALLGDFHVAVFSYQQAAEKALKAVLLAQGKNIKKTHDLNAIGRQTGLPKSMQDGARWLSNAYIQSRYGMVEDKIPAEAFTAKHSAKAAFAAEELITWCRKNIAKKK